MERWLTVNPYLCGQLMTLADISASCELIQTKFIDMDLSKWPKTQAWLKRMIYDIPEMLEIHQQMFKFAEISVKQQREREQEKAKL